MYLAGWSMPSLSWGLMGNKLSNPDVLVITLPFLYLVILPVIVLVFGLFAEKAVAYLRRNIRAEDTADPANLTAESARCLPGAPWVPMNSNKKIKSLVVKFCGGWTRRVLILACLIIAAIHLKLSSMLMSAYGTTPVALSPPLTWMPLLLLSVAAYCTMLPAD